jgi:hypothetical protein
VGDGVHDPYDDDDVGDGINDPYDDADVGDRVNMILMMMMMWVTE